MVSVALFVVVITMGMTALLNAHSIDRKNKDMRSIIDSLSFIMEDAARNIRVGTNYRCYDIYSPFSYPDSNIEIPRSSTPSSPNCLVIAFENANGVVGSGGDQWVYKLEGNNIYKSTNGGNNFFSLNNPGEVVINSFSGFNVLGAEEPPPGECNTSNDCQQPLTFIKLSGYINYKNVQTPFNLQTTVSQRFGDRP